MGPYLKDLSKKITFAPKNLGSRDFGCLGTHGAKKFFVSKSSSYVGTLCIIRLVLFQLLFPWEHGF